MTFPRVLLRRVARLGSGHTPSRSVPDYWENCTIPWLTLGDIAQLRDDSTTVITQTRENVSPLGIANSAAEVHPRGTIALSRTASVGFSCILGTDMATSQDFATWTPGPLLEPRFGLWALRGLRNEILGLRQGSTHQTIYMPDIARIEIPLPDITTQRRIAEYLDAETRRIDGLLERKRRAIALMEERRLAMMADAVAGRATSSGPFVGSTLPWLPEIREGWQVVLLRLVARLGSGHTPSRSRPELWEGCTIPWVTTGEVAQLRSDRVEYIEITREKISELGLQNSAATLHPAGTVVLCRTASAGYSGIMATDMATSQDFVTWTCGPHLRPRFLLLCLRAMRPDLLGRLAQGSTHQTIYMPDIRSLRIPLPPLAEQDEIVDAAWERLGAVFGAIEKLEDQIELLQEHRQALITAAVAGEIDVPEAA